MAFAVKIVLLPEILGSEVTQRSWELPLWYILIAAGAVVVAQVAVELERA